MASLAAVHRAAGGQIARFRNDVYDAGPNGAPTTDIESGSVGITDASRYGTIYTSSIAASKWCSRELIPKMIHTWCPTRLIGMDTESGLDGVHVLSVFSLRCDPQRCRVVVANVIYLPTPHAAGRNHSLQNGFTTTSAI